MGLVFILLIVFYFAPTVVAMMRGHKDAPAIAFINILFGWTFIAWIVTMIWALADPRGRAASQTVIVNTDTRVNSPTVDSAVPAIAASPMPAENRLGGGSGSLEVDLDTAFWDSMTDKTDHDALEEYLTRFPVGKFIGLAQTRLERAGRPWLALPPPAPDKGAKISTCEKCGEVLEPDSVFCSSCGHAAPTDG